MTVGKIFFQGGSSGFFQVGEGNSSEISFHQLENKGETFFY